MRNGLKKIYIYPQFFVSGNSLNPYSSEKPFSDWSGTTQSRKNPKNMIKFTIIKLSSAEMGDMMTSTRE